MGRQKNRGTFERWLLLVTVAIGCVHAIRGQAQVYKTYEPLPDCWKIERIPASDSPCACEPGKNACSDYKYASLTERKDCVGVLPGENGQHGCQLTSDKIGERGLCVMRIDKDAEAQLRNCENGVVALFVICLAGTPPPLDVVVCGGGLVAGLATCANDYGRYPCSLWKCVQDPSFRLDAMGSVATGFDQRPGMSGNCRGKGPG